jgi:hypothetical protein
MHNPLTFLGVHAEVGFPQKSTATFSSALAHPSDSHALPDQTLRLIRLLLPRKGFRFAPMNAKHRHLDVADGQAPSPTQTSPELGCNHGPPDSWQPPEPFDAKRSVSFLRDEFG